MGAILGQMPTLLATVEIADNSAVPYLLTAGLAAVISSTGQCTAPSAAGQGGMVGVTHQTPAGANAKWTAPVVVEGIARCVSDGSGALDEGDYITIADTSGRFKKAGSFAFGGSTIEHIVGIAVTPCAATAGNIFYMLIARMIHKP